MFNFKDETVNVKYPCNTDRAAYMLSCDSGKAIRLGKNTDGEEYEPIRLLPGGNLVIAWNCDEEDTNDGAEPKRVREIHALKRGDNNLSFSFNDEDSAVIEIDRVNAPVLTICVNGEKFKRFISAPYTVDISSVITDGECTVSLVCDGEIVGAVLRLM